MNFSKSPLRQHYLALTGIIILGAVVRFWHLDLKPLWADEVLTALFSLGRNYDELPLDVVFSLPTLSNIFTLEPGTSCAEIAQALARQSTHPPLFFCLMHRWLAGLGEMPLVWGLRSLPALFGVCAIAAVYWLNRLIFSPTAGLMGAALMAVSPFGVYLSQEARHYTLPMLLVILALLALIRLQQALYSQQSLQPILWVLWGIVNSIGCYVHYFFILAFIAQLLTLGALMYRHRTRLPKGSWLALILVVAGVALSYLPWLGVLLADVGSPETGWLPEPANVAPLFQMLVGWLTMAIALPVESQPLWIAIPSALLTLGFGGWLGWQGWRGLQQLWHQPAARLATVTLGGFILCVLLQFLAIVYVLGKDITVAPRYNFVYYPAVWALLGASLANGRGWRLKSTAFAPAFLLSLSFLSCLLVTSNLVFIKPFHPQQVAQDMNVEPNAPLLMVMGYDNIQHVALGLSFALALDGEVGANGYSPPPMAVQSEISGSLEISDRISFAFLNRSAGYDNLWQKLSELPALSAPHLNLWIVAPGLRRRDYPQTLTLAPQKPCTLDPNEHHRIGVPYQLYRCR